MKMCLKIGISVVLLFMTLTEIKAKPNEINKRPHIIVMLADDLGWNDVSFHGSNQIPTPNIDALAYNGIILNSHYSQALCTPSRAAFLTGKYPIRTGMQHSVILEPEPRGLPLNEKLLPQYLKEAGYATHVVGKWHLGFYRHEFTPTYRGFDTHFGYWNGFQDYYNHYVKATFNANFSGYDMRRGLTPDYSASGKYSTDIFADEAARLIREHDKDTPMFLYLAHLAPHTGNRDDPLQAPDEEIAKFGYIADPERRVYAAMVSMLDKSVGKVIAALREKNMLENSIVVFVSDNGAPVFGIHANHGSNYPLRGMKNSPWEGGMRSVACIWSPFLKNTQRVSDQLMHITDWLPTFLTAAGIDTTRLDDIDGINMWEALSQNLTSPRTEMLYNVDEIDNYGAIRRGDFKYILGTTGKGRADHWFGDTGEGDYPFTDEEVLASQTASALAGFVTDMQIAEKLRRGSNVDSSNYSFNLLTKEKVSALRKEAILTCGDKDSDEISHAKCNPLESPCLFNIKEDPCERINLASDRPMILLSLENALAKYKKGMLEASNVPEDPMADPRKWNNTWVPWHDCEEVQTKHIGDTNLTPVGIAVLATLCILFLIVVMALIALSVKNKVKKAESNSQVFNEDNLDAPTSVVHVKTDEPSVSSSKNGKENGAKNESFENNEFVRQNSMRNGSKSIE